MEQYTDDERVEDLKKWWKDNGASIIAGIALGLLAIFGWKYWGDYRNTQAERASQAYDAFIALVEKPDIAQAQQRGQALLTDFSNSSYAALTALRLAKLAVDAGDNATATQQLEWVINNAKLDELKDIARLRLARVLLAAKQPSEVEKLLERVTTATLIAEREELKGDLYLAGNDAAKARAAYVAAQTASGGNPLLQIKLDNLSAPTPESVVPAPPAPPPTAATTPPAQAQSAAAIQATTTPVPPTAPTEPPAATTPSAALTEPPATTAPSSAVPTEPPKATVAPPPAPEPAATLSTPAVPSPPTGAAVPAPATTRLADPTPAPPVDAGTAPASTPPTPASGQ